MTDIKRCVQSFMRKHGMHFDSVDIEKGCSEFIDDMERGLEGKESSLRMICTYISPEGQIPINEPVAVMDAGGTNFRVALVHFDIDVRPVIENYQSYPMPGSTGEITREEFYDTVSEYLMSIAGACQKFGWCFSFPTEILPNGDGRLLYFDKEVRVSDMNGDIIGASLLQTLAKKGVKGNKSISILNDTVATLLGGKAACPNRRFGSYIGYILGTGTNTCYIEDNSGIKKHPALQLKPGTTIINTESGGFNKAVRGSIDIEFDSRTADPGAQQLEKMVSGAYQGSIVYWLLHQACREGLFSADFTEYLKGVPAIEASDINDFCLYPYSHTGILSKGMSGCEEDRLTAFWLIDIFIERAARLSAMNLAACIIKSGKGSNPCLPVCIAAEGTTFYKSALFRKKLDYYVKHCLNDRMGIYSEFVRAENATLIGTAIAGLLNGTG